MMQKKEPNYARPIPPVPTKSGRAGHHRAQFEGEIKKKDKELERALDLIQLCPALPHKQEFSIVSKQLMRSAPSLGSPSFDGLNDNSPFANCYTLSYIVTH